MHENLRKLLAFALAAFVPLGALDMAVAEDLPSLTVPAQVKSETPATRDLTVTIVWNDDENAKDTRPKTVSVFVTGSDGSHYSASAQRPSDGKPNTHKNWQVTFYGLPETDGQNEIVYTVEAGIPEGYRYVAEGLNVYLTLKVPEATATPAPEANPRVRGRGQGFTMQTAAPATATPAPVVSEAPAPATALPATAVPATATPAPVETEAPAPATEAPVIATRAPAGNNQPAMATEAPAPTEAPAEKQGVQIKVNADTDMRLEANGMSVIIHTIPVGTAVTVLGIEGDWAKVDADGVIGYIYKDSINEWDQLKPKTDEDEKPGEDECPIKVTIFTSRRAVMEPGETVTLTSKIEGSEGYEIKLQWQWDRGNGFEDVPGANEDHYSFEASIETLSYSWQLVVYYR